MLVHFWNMKWCIIIDLWERDATVNSISFCQIIQQNSPYLLNNYYTHIHIHCYGTQPADYNELFLLLLISGEYSSQRWVLPSLTLWQSDWCSTPFYLCCIMLSLIYFVPCKPGVMSFFWTLYWSTTYIYIFFFHHTTCESTCDTMSSSATNQGW